MGTPDTDDLETLRRYNAELQALRKRQNDRIILLWARIDGLVDLLNQGLDTKWNKKRKLDTEWRSAAFAAIRAAQVARAEQPEQ